MKINNQIITNILLLGILLFLAGIYLRMPPTLDDYFKATGDDLSPEERGKRSEMLQGKIPFVNIFRDVNVKTLIDPIDVRIEDQPIEVEIRR